MRKTISGAGMLAALAVVLAGGLLFLPAGLTLLYVLCRRREELEKGELEDAKNY